MSMLSSNRNGQSISVEQMFQERMQKKQQQRQAVQQSNAERTKEIAEKADEMQKPQTMADVMKDAGIDFYSHHQLYHERMGGSPSHFFIAMNLIYNKIRLKKVQKIFRKLFRRTFPAFQRI